MKPLNFFSDEWIQAVRESINNGPPEGYKEDKLFLYWNWIEAAASVLNTTLVFGIKDMNSSDGRTAYASLTFEKGVCTSAKLVNEAEAMTAPFVLAGKYSDWKAMINGYDVGKSIMYRKLMLDKGDVYKFFHSIYFWAEALVSLTRVPTSFSEERAA